MSLIPDYTLSILIACLIVLLVISIRRRLDYFSSRGIPYVRPTFRLFLYLLSPTKMLDYFFQLFEDLKDKYNPVVGYFDQFLNPNILVLDPSMVQNIFIKDFSHFHDHGVEVNTSLDPLLGHLFNMKGDQWRALRIKLLPTFTSGKLKGMIPTMNTCALSVISDMKRDDSLRQDVNLKDLFKRFTIATIASCGFGIEPESVSDSNSDFQKILLLALSTTLMTQMKFILIFSFPKLAAYLKIKAMRQEVDDYFINLTRETMEMRKRSGIKRNDFIQLLMELKEKGSVQVDHRDLEEDEKDLMKQQQQLAESEATSKLEMTDELLTAQVFVFIGAGFDNSSFLVSITAHLLSKNKDIQQRVREEVRAAKVKYGGINYEALKQMKLLEASINEAMRMYPPLFFLFRGCTRNYNLPDGTTIEKGTMMFIPLKSLQNDTKYWKNPKEFNPDRFFTDDIVPGTYLPFGDGPRLCIAQRFAVLMGKIMLAQLIDNYQILPSKKTKEPLNQTFIVSAEVQGGLWGSFEPLSQ